ncbi:MAG: S41 family peptidase [Rudaea sp.]|nr:S41 family peptidase [Rudaea sp.]
MMRSIQRNIIALSLLAAGLCGNGQIEAGQRQPPIYSPAELQEDYAVLRKALETTYPSLYRFTDRSIMSQYLDDAFRSLDKPETETEFYKLVALTCARVHDEHLIPRPSEAYYLSLKDTHHYFPFSLKIIDRRLYVLTTAQPNSAVPTGSEILSINGRSAEELLATLLPSIPSDGYIQNFDLRHLEDYSMTEEENLFDLNYPILVEDTDSYRIEYIDRSDQSKISVAVVAGLGQSDYKRYLYDRVKLKAPLEFKYLASDIAYLRIASFLPWHRARFKQDFYALFESIFKDLNAHHTGNLILDLRNNEGGDGTGEKLLTYLLNKPYRHFASAEFKFVGSPPVSAYLQNGKDLSVDESSVERTDSGMYRLKKTSMPLLDEQRPDVNHYSGKLYVLINGATGSMASVVADFLKGNGRGTFIGEESGGTMEGNTSHSIARLVLPHSKIRVAVPLLKTVNAVAFTKGRGVEPDYRVGPTIDDLMKGVDTELMFTINLIGSKN